MRFDLGRFLLWSAFALVIVGAGVQLWRNGTATPAAIAEGTEAPVLQGVTAKGELFERDWRQGGPAIALFWATWCPSCRSELPMVEALAREQGLPLILATVDEGPEGLSAAAKYLAGRKLSSPALIQPTAESVVAWRFDVLPTLYVIDGEGRVAAGFSGSVSKRALSRAIDKSLGRSAGD